MQHAKSKVLYEATEERLGRKEKEHRTRRRDILDAALKLFSRKGYSGTSISEIAQASEFSVGSIYNFFETKENLYLTIVEEKFRETSRRMSDAVAMETDCVRKIAKAVRAVLISMEENRDFYNLFLGIQTVPEPAVHGGVHRKALKLYEDHINFFMELMEEGVHSGIFREFTPLELAYSLIGICNANIYNWLQGPGDTSLVAHHERILDLFFRGTLKTSSNSEGNNYA